MGVATRTAVANLPTRLQRAREQARLEIADISARTKIKPAFIAALENGHWEQLPGQFFTRAFLKAYAAEVRIDPAQVAREYDEAVGRTDPITLAEFAAVVDKKYPAVPPLHQRLMAQWDALGTFRKLSGPEWRVASPLPSDHQPSLRLRVPRVPDIGIVRPVAAALVMVVVAVAAAVSWTPSRQPEAGAVGTSGVAEAAAATPPVPEKVTIDIVPTAQIWVSAKADGNPAIFRMLQTGERVSLSATSDLTFRIGNAAAFTYTLNGVPGKALGGPDEVREFQITPQNVHSFRR